MSDNEILAQVRDIIADVLDQPDLQVTPATTADNVEGWDSFNHINIVVAVEAHFGIKIHTAEIEELRNCRRAGRTGREEAEGQEA